MLTAKTSRGELISLGEGCERNFLQTLRKKEDFYCISCNERVLLKLGTKRIFHFAHEKGAACTDYYDRETEYHMLGKQKLYEWFKKLGLKPKLEPYFPPIKQRADIAFQYKGTTYCIEFQCSTISEELFTKRSKGYRKLSYVPVWILAGKNIARRNHHKVSLSGFQYCFLQRNSNQEWFLPSYCPLTNLLINLTNILPISSQKTLANFSIKSLSASHLEDLLDPPITFNPRLSEWRMEIYRFKTMLLTHPTPGYRPFLYELYTNQLNPQLIPPYVGIPLRLNPVIQHSSFIWQSYIFMDHIFGQPLGQQIPFHKVFVSVLRRVEMNHIKLRSLPNIKERLLPFVILEYFTVLEKIGLLEKKSETTFRITKQIQLARNLDEQRRIEELFYKDLL